MPASIPSRLASASRRLLELPRHLEPLQRSESPRLPETLEQLDTIERAIGALETLTKRGGAA